ncbi:hypothetical protein BHM03_00007870 [Ensete ventricosum]|nr:hypothetical protein BHM03_00007870 [Ensete ventricosum]
MNLPTRGQYNSLYNECNLGFALDPWTNKYKVICYFWYIDDFHSVHKGSEVFTLGTSTAWRATAEPAPYLTAIKSSACVEGAIYWFIDSKRCEPKPESIILSFSLVILESVLVSRDVQSLLETRSALRQLFRSEALSVMGGISSMTVDRKLSTVQFFVWAFALVGDVEVSLDLVVYLVWVIDF